MTTLSPVSPPPCQVEEHKNKTVKFQSPPSAPDQCNEPQHLNKSGKWNRNILPDRRKSRQIRKKQERLESVVTNGRRIVAALMKDIKQIDRDRHDAAMAPPVKLPEFQEQELIIPELTMSTQWFTASNNAPTYDIAASVHDAEPPQQNNKPLYDYVKPVVAPKDADAEMKWKVLNGKVRTGFADAGASESCGQP